LNGDASFSVSKETEDRIWQAANELGYRKNRIKNTRCREGASNTKKIGYIIDWNKEKFDDTSYMAIIHGIEQEMLDQKQQLVFSYKADVLNNPLVINSIVSGLCDGVVLLGAIPLENYNLIARIVPHVVCVLEAPYNSPLDCVTVDFEEYSYLLVSNLILKGHKRIAFIGGPTYGAVEYPFLPGRHYEYEARLRGYLKAHADHGIEIDKALVCNVNWDTERAYTCTKELIGACSLTAIFASCDRLAIGSMRAIHECGLSVPDDISIVGYDDAEISRYLSPSLTTVQYAKEDIGRIAVKLLIERINNNTEVSGDETGKRIIFPQKIIYRDSVKSIRI
jgi:DNA-binding LacI/PurR family transcriptional regulator